MNLPTKKCIMLLIIFGLFVMMKYACRITQVDSFENLTFKPLDLDTPINTISSSLTNISNKIKDIQEYIEDNNEN